MVAILYTNPDSMATTLRMVPVVNILRLSTPLLSWYPLLSTLPTLRMVTMAMYPLVTPTTTTRNPRIGAEQLSLQKCSLIQYTRAVPHSPRRNSSKELNPVIFQMNAQTRNFLSSSASYSECRWYCKHFPYQRKLPSSVACVNASRTVFSRGTRWSVVERAFLNPHWHMSQSSRDSKINISLIFKTFLKDFMRQLVRATGL